MDHVGTAVRRLREERGLNQTQLAVSVGTGPSAISQIENGRRSPNSETLVKLARALKVEVADLFPKGHAPLPFEARDPEFGLWVTAATMEDLLKKQTELSKRIGELAKQPGGSLENVKRQPAAEKARQLRRLGAAADQLHVVAHELAERFGRKTANTA